jgi:hypothetical protein
VILKGRSAEAAVIVIISCFLVSFSGQDNVQEVKNGNSPREKTLDLLFDRAVSNLIGHSTYKITSRTPAALLPILPSQDELGITAEYFYGPLSRSFSDSGLLNMIEAHDINKIIEKNKLTLADLSDETNAEKIGKSLHADVLITGRLYKKGEVFELFLKLLRVKTGEVLSVTRVNIDRDLESR